MSMTEEQLQLLVEQMVDGWVGGASWLRVFSKSLPREGPPKPPIALGPEEEGVT